MTLQDRLDAFKADFEAGKPPYNVPPAVIETMHRATAELIASGQAERARHVGDVAPAFTLADPDGHPVSSAALLAHGPLVLTFYRGVWCPYCNMELAGSPGGPPRDPGAGCRLGGDLAADATQQSQVDPAEPADLPDPERRRG